MNFFSEISRLFLMYLFLSLIVDLTIKTSDKVNLKTAFYFRSIVAKILGALCAAIVGILLRIIF